MTEAPSIKEALGRAREYIKPAHPGDIQADADLRAVDDALATFQPDGERREAIARAISWLRKFRFMSYNTGFLWMADDAEKIASLLESLASGLVQDEAGWRDISTAPKDGTEIWAYNGEQARMKFFDADPTEEGYSLWIWSDDLMNDVDPSPEPPTHWMPIPEAPPIRSARDGGAET